MVAYIPGLILFLLLLALVMTIAGWAGKVSWQPPLFVVILALLLGSWPK